MTKSCILYKINLKILNDFRLTNMERSDCK